MRCGFGIAGVMFLAGCASYLGTARDYTVRGRHELAVYYLGGHYRAHRDPEAKAELVRGIENAKQRIEAQYDELAGQSRQKAALGAATRLEDLIDFARSLGLGEFTAVDGGRLVKQALPKAAKQAVREVDRAEETGISPREQTALLRTALALDPHNPELASRYTRLVSSLLLNLAPRIDCDSANAKDCRHFIGLLGMRLTAERGEFTRLVSENSPVRNAELVVTATVKRSDSDWKRTKSAKAENKVEVRNRFNEVQRDSKGKKVYKKVRAHYQVFERTTRAEAAVSVLIRDLRPNGKVLYNVRRTAQEQDRRSYVTWKGDERALGKLSRLGTDRTPPRDPDLLVRQLMNKLADQFSKQMLANLEGSKK